VLRKSFQPTAHGQTVNYRIKRRIFSLPSLTKRLHQQVHTRSSATAETACDADVEA